MYLLNRFPTRSMNERTPYEAWKGDKPSIVLVQVFGCLAHMKTTGTHMMKLDNRSKVVVHIGNEPGMKPYRLYDPENNNILVSRDVIFEEGKMWEWNHTQLEPSTTSQGFTFTIVGSLEEHVSSEENSQ